MIVVGIAAGWLLCAFLTYGFNYAYLQREYPLAAPYDRRDDFFWSIKLGLITGPAGLVLTLQTGGYRHGFMWR